MSHSKADVEKALLFWDRLFWYGVAGSVIAGVLMFVSSTHSDRLRGNIGVFAWVCFGTFLLCVGIVALAYVREEMLKKRIL